MTVQEKTEYKVTPYRWLVLLAFILYAVTNLFQWLSFSAINEKVSLFYDVRPATVDWLAMVFMITYIPLIFPASWLLDRKGLRVTACLGTFLNCLGAAIKCFSPYSGRFAVLMAGQTIAGMSQVFILGLPPRVAAVWFAEKEVPAATGLGVFGVQLGLALAFLVPLIVPTVNIKNDTTGPEVYDPNLATLYYLKAGVTTFVFLIVLLVVRDKPLHPPSPAQDTASHIKSDISYFQWFGVLFRNINFWALLVCFGLIVGAFNAFCTLIHQLVLIYFPGDAENAGYLGLSMALAAVAGSLSLGFFLGWCGKLKATASVTYLISLFCMAIFMIVLHFSAGHMWPLFVVAVILGFFVAGFIPIGYELAAEITYPAAEGTTSGLMNCSIQIAGLTLTAVMGQLLKQYGPLAAQGLLVAALFLGAVITFFMKADLKRTAVLKLREKEAIISPISSAATVTSTIPA